MIFERIFPAATFTLLCVLCAPSFSEEKEKTADPAPRAGDETEPGELDLDALRELARAEAYPLCSLFFLFLDLFRLLFVFRSDVDLILSLE